MIYCLSREGALTFSKILKTILENSPELTHEDSIYQIFCRDSPFCGGVFDHEEFSFKFSEKDFMQYFSLQILLCKLQVNFYLELQNNL